MEDCTLRSANGPASSTYNLGVFVLQCRGSLHQSSYTATPHFKFMFPFNLHIPPASPFSRHSLENAASHNIPPALIAFVCPENSYGSLHFCQVYHHGQPSSVLLHSSHGMGQVSHAQGKRIPLPHPRAGGDGPSWQLHHKGTLMEFPSCLVI